MAEPSKVEQALIEANKIMSQFMPLIAISGMAFRGIATILRALGKDKEAKEFEAEYDKTMAIRGELGKSLDDFRKKYPLGPVAEPGGPVNSER